MTHIEKIIQKLTKTQRNRLETLRKIYKTTQSGNTDCTKAKAQISAYLRGLADADAISETDFQVLFIFYTL